MKKLKIWLSSLLVVQLALAGGIFLLQQNQQSRLQPQPLLALDDSRVNRLVIESDGQSLTLQKADGNWQLPELQGLPANPDKIQKALSSLTALNSGWPVATTSSSHERFEVAESRFRKRIRLYDGDNLLGDLLLGTSPGFRKTHVRTAGKDPVFALALNSYDFPDKADQWLDKTLLAVKDVTAIKGPDFDLIKRDGEWVLNNTEQDADQNTQATELDKQKADELIQALANLNVYGIADNPPAFDTAQVVSLSIKGADNRQYQFVKQDNKYYVKRQGSDQVFTLNEYAYNKLAGTALSDLTIAGNNSTTEDGGSEASGPQQTSEENPAG